MVDEYFERKAERERAQKGAARRRGEGS